MPAAVRTALAAWAGPDFMVLKVISMASPSNRMMTPQGVITLHSAVKYLFSAPIRALGSSFSEIIEGPSMSANSTLACLASPAQAWIRSSAVVMRLATLGATKRKRSWAAALPTAA